MYFPDASLQQYRYNACSVGINIGGKLDVGVWIAANGGQTYRKSKDNSL
jgi:hypothetical protein